MTSTPKALVGAIDQGTSSSRFLVFNPADESVVAQHQIAIKSMYPQEGWCEQDPEEILQSVKECIAKVSGELQSRGIGNLLKAIGITNQRETTVVWDAETSRPLYNAIVWLDTRTKATSDKLIAHGGGQDVLRAKCGLPISTYFSAVKLRWLLDNVPSVCEAAKKGRLCFGTVDTWLLWNLVKDANGKNIHMTDVTNASRTMLMNLRTLQWDQELMSFFSLPEGLRMPEIRSSSEIYGHLSYDNCPYSEVPVSGCLGDQQAALVGHQCFRPGSAKNTYGTGCFMLFNVGTDIVTSTHGMLSTVGYQLGPDADPVYALEGSIAIAGAAIAWLRDNLGIISSAKDVEKKAAEVENTGGVYFVPAFSGLFAPHWRPDARGIVCGLTQYSKASHICRAALEAVSFQTREILEAMNKDSGVPLQKLVVDGAMTKNNLLMQIQADFLGLDVIRPEMPEITSLGAALAAGRAVNVWNISESQAPVENRNETVFSPEMKDEDRNSRYDKWIKAVKKSLDWA